MDTNTTQTDFYFQRDDMHSEMGKNMIKLNILFACVVIVSCLSAFCFILYNANLFHLEH